jgi:hypothetical protein
MKTSLTLHSSDLAKFPPGTVICFGDSGSLSDLGYLVTDTATGTLTIRPVRWYDRLRWWLKALPARIKAWFAGEGSDQ